jgi:molybdopterin/thiamine biosynthesis adenylyltransferase
VENEKNKPTVRDLDINNTENRKPKTENPLEIKAIGIGGIGCALLPFLCRFLQYCRQRARVTLIDGDYFERRNAPRQTFGRMGNKAQVKATELAQEFNALSLRAIPEYIGEDNAVHLIGEHDLVFLMVDNHNTRNLVNQRVQVLNNVILISGGNDWVDGNVQVYIRRQGQDLTPNLGRYHPEIARPADRHPTELGCEELMESGEPQLLFTNLAIAASMLNAFYAWREGRLAYSEVYVDIMENRSRAVNRSI